MTGDTYLTLSSNGEAVYTEKRSKFYAFAEHVEDEESAKARVAALRKQFYDARHVCFAYALDFDGERTRTNDDGEPSGTAGRPILGALRSAGLTFALIVVVRYFGGVKLGTGGLVVAYREAAAAKSQLATSRPKAPRSPSISGCHCLLPCANVSPKSYHCAFSTRRTKNNLQIPTDFRQQSIALHNEAPLFFQSEKRGLTLFSTHARLSHPTFVESSRASRNTN